MSGTPSISIIIPTLNGAATLGLCLEAIARSEFRDFETIVIDDGSTDGSAEIARRYPCTLIELGANKGSGAARNAGARAAQGAALLFVDSDCLVNPDTLGIGERLYFEHPAEAQGGTYTPMPYDGDFFSRFQSVFIHYNETRVESPDYVAAHAMLIGREVFMRSGGFPEQFLPIIEDVEFSHRLRRQGVSLRAAPALLVRHIFRFSLGRSLKNAYRKSMYWTMYSCKNRDLHADSGTASRELKINALCWVLCSFSAVAGLYGVSAMAAGVNAMVNLGLMRAYFRAGGAWFGLRAMLYYIALYPLPVGLGGIAGLFRGRRA